MQTALTIQELGREKIELIKQTVAKGATDIELDLFLHACKHTGLDPLMKQIYAIKRWSQADGREVLSFQTGIDGYRLIADRTGKYAGSSDAIYEEKDGKPLMAQVTVLKIIDGEKCAFTASARWEEYVQKNRQMEPTSMWKKMPYLMLAKCAEAQALRKAFPMELSGLYTNEEMVHLDSEWKTERGDTPLPTGAEMLAKLENSGIDAASPRGGQTPQGAGMANEPVKSPDQRNARGGPASAPSAQGALVTPPLASAGDEPAGATEPPAAAFIWRIGKEHTGESISTIAGSYLEWFVQNGKRADHVEAAALELDRRRGQGSLS